MENRSELQVGAALLAGTVVLLVGLLWFQGYRYGRDHVQLQVRFEEVGGLGAGDPVQVRGLPMGKVESIELEADGVLATLSLDAGVRVREDSRFEVSSFGVMGERVVAMSPGEGTILPTAEGKVFVGSYGAGLPDMLGQADDLSQQLSSLLARSESLLTKLDERLPGALDDLSRAASGTASLLEDSGEDLRKASRTLASAGQQLDEFLKAQRPNLERSIEGLARQSADLDTLLGRLDRVAKGSEGLLTALREQKGAAGKAIYDEQMGKDLAESIQGMRKLVEDIRRNPQRYLTVKIF